MLQACVEWGVREALVLHLEGVVADEEKRPQAHEVDFHLENPDLTEAVWAVIDFDLTPYLGKSVRFNDVIAAWRMNPALAGCMPENAAGFGDIGKIDRVYTNNEIRPISQLFLQVNQHLRRDRRVAWNEPLESPPEKR